ncbi:Ubiquitin-conjugating enzyme E2 [Echinococcus granulosus]|uniref:E2 ubiquitin-conjugating enzyme n=1 Tax=Echinococcus granulosus TaxID=6210 RepID=U6J1J3_ECHGR|nr:Ubiquitin-conjugating enzyme E2 [Echinococcus granulosus]EUB64455.1 Ubiquitin-conjugating enzyme E2 [Echinococcus granulosus]CDS17171.1 ubiquitin conjugating enzyme e2S [Echinococcus granulosus]
MENVYPHFARTVCKEVRDIMGSSIDGIKLVLNDADFSVIQATIDGPKDTPFEGGRFNIKLVLPSNYPIEPPRGYFTTKIFHPNINWHTGDICVDTLKKEWRPDLGLRHILVTIRCLLIAPNPESALNEEAGKLLLEDYNEYTKQARLFTEVHALVSDATKKSSVEGEAASSALRDSNGQSNAKLKKSMKAQKKVSVARKMIRRL